LIIYYYNHWSKDYFNLIVFVVAADDEEKRFSGHLLRDAAFKEGLSVLPPCDFALLQIGLNRDIVACVGEDGSIGHHSPCTDVTAAAIVIDAFLGLSTAAAEDSICTEANVKVLKGEALCLQSVGSPFPWSYL
jgi:hypothetical protein